MATMTCDPYVNHVPTMTGGVGASELRRFYAHHFITRQPGDFEVVPVSRTVGEETLVDEMDDQPNASSIERPTVSAPRSAGSSA